ncbi:MAG TPA: ATP-binding protein [Acetobacteraceae bacterium]|nr:ATP-binding protein [Acetobacteraceae bacterium]
MELKTEPAARPAFSLRGRLLALWLMSLFAFLVVGALIIGLYRQSAAASLARDRGETARACEAITLHYNFYTAGMASPPAALDDPGFAAALRAVVALGLRRFPGVEGAILQTNPALGGPILAGAPPAVLRGAALDAGQDAVAAEHLIIRETGGGGTVLAACPLSGTMSDLAAVTYMRVPSFGTVFSRQALAGLAVLFATLLASAWFLARLVLGFSRRLRAVEAALATPGGEGLPELPPTGERELDRLIAALNGATGRLKAAQARMAQAEKLAALGRMAAGLAHEIRNPLGAIRLRAEGALEADDRRRQAALGTVLAEVARLESLTSKLLSFAASPAPRAEPCAVDEIIAQAIEPLRDLAAARSVAIIAGPAPFTARLDRVLTARALENLARNAVEACGAGDRVEVAARQEEGMTILSVTDTGPGVPPSMGDIFEPFVTGRPDGTGLGLAIARDMIRAQGGRIDLLPAPGRGAGRRGAAFRITLPDAG